MIIRKKLLSLRKMITRNKKKLKVNHFKKRLLKKILKKLYDKKKNK